MAYPKSYWVPTSEDLGKIWRELINLVINKEISNYKTLKEVTLYFYEKDQQDEDWMRKYQGKNINHDLEIFKYVLEFWFQNREKLISEIDSMTFTHSSIANDIINNIHKTIFFDGRYADYGKLKDEKKLKEFENNYILGDELINYYNNRSYFDRNINIINFITQYLRQILNLEQFVTIVKKSWSQDIKNQNHLSFLELGFLARYFEQKKIDLTTDLKVYKRGGKLSFDEIKVEVTHRYSPLFGRWDIISLLDIYIGDAIVDFIEEIISFNNFSSVKGSVQCIECGKFYPKSFYGRGQKYCSQQCKARAAKRRQRERAKKKNWIKNRQA